jgi:NAD(P)-dependent dehydrogenase (short-subunit alcohol dehydrogenase family)
VSDVRVTRVSDVRATRVSDVRATRVLITGATSGLGLAMAEALAGAGARVAIAGREASRAESVASRIGSEAIGLELDVRDEASVHSGVEHVYERLGGLDMLVNNAGVGMRTVNPRFMTEPQGFWEVTKEGFRNVLCTKVTGCFLVAREVVPRMLEAGAGRLVTISMNEGTMIRQGFVPYGPSGAAVEALARVMAADLADTPVRANILLPGGATETGMIPDVVPDEVRAQLLDPGVMGPPIVWLASQAADDVHDERIVAAEFDEWLAARTGMR